MSMNIPGLFLPLRPGHRLIIISDQTYTRMLAPYPTTYSSLSVFPLLPCFLSSVDLALV